MARNAEICRKTKETDIKIKLEIDGSGKASIDSGVGFFDHMLNSFFFHGRFDGSVDVKGDTYVDCHHSVEDTGIVLGCAFDNALGDRKGINRFGTAYVPMDEALAFASVDISGRPYLVFDCNFPAEKIGDIDTEVFLEFFRAFAFNAKITLHIRLLYGTNSHHMAEAVFKAAARALSEAAKTDGNIYDTPSTKGMI